MIRTRLLNEWLGTQYRPEQVMADPQRFEEMVTAVEALMQLQGTRRNQQRRDQAVKSWFATQQAGHVQKYMRYRQ